MKAKLFLLLVLGGLVALGTDTPAQTNAPPATITGVSAAKDRRALVIRYELLGRSHEQQVTFTNDIADFRYCPWNGERGIALVACTHNDEFYYATLYLTGNDVRTFPVRVPAPASKSRLLGIANTGGDSIVITAVQHRREGSSSHFHGPDRLSGWMFIDNCPPIGAIAGLVIPFDIPTEHTSKKK